MNTRVKRTDKLGLIKIKKEQEKEAFEKKIEAVMLETCKNCKGKGRHDVEVYTRLYEEQKCELCNGIGKSLSNFARRLIEIRK